MLQAETEMFNIHILWKVNLSLWKSIGGNTAELFWSAITRWRGNDSKILVSSVSLNSHPHTQLTEKDDGMFKN